MLTADVKEMMLDSSNTFLKNLFSTEYAPTQSGSRKTVSLSHRFKTSLDSLMKTLYACHPFFVRCIKPNEFKKPRVSNYYQNDSYFFLQYNKVEPLFNIGLYFLTDF